MIISVVCDLKWMPEAKNYIHGLDWWALYWFLSGHILTVLSRLLNGRSSLKRFQVTLKRILNGSERLLSRSYVVLRQWELFAIDQVTVQCTTVDTILEGHTYFKHQIL